MSKLDEVMDAMYNSAGPAIGKSRAKNRIKALMLELIESCGMDENNHGSWVSYAELCKKVEEL